MLESEFLANSMIMMLRSELVDRSEDPCMAVLKTLKEAGVPEPSDLQSLPTGVEYITRENPCT